ncbi:MAG: hypothetical protein OXR82_08755 [Gammaproteobacteria bacterium]|nr:hypothetical protein [Gammaproteobacteria bacterium]
MKFRHAYALVLALLAAALVACESTEPEIPLYDVQLAVDCTGCSAHHEYATLRVMLRPAAALLPDGYVRTDMIAGWNQWHLGEVGTVVLDAFSEVPAGDYIVTAASPFLSFSPLFNCRGVQAADTVLNHNLSRDRRFHPYVWPYIRVTVPSTEPTSGLLVGC